MDAQTLFNVSNILFLIGTSLLIRVVLKNRKVLNGYDWLGAVLTLMAMLTVEGAYVLLNFWVSLLFSLPTVAYWILVSVYSIRNKLKLRMQKRKCQWCGSTNISLSYRFKTVPSEVEMKRFYCNECGHVSIYAKGEKNWRVG